MNWKSILLLLILPNFFSCSKTEAPAESASFIKHEAASSGIKFANQITENDTLNYFNFPYLYLGGGASVGDINNDGKPDLYFTGNQVANKLYLNKGNFQFEDITEQAGVAGDNRWYAGSTLIDINNDGLLDIYLSVAGKFGNTENQLFINQGDNTFKEAAKEYGIADEGISIQSTFFDYNGDGLQDLFVANYPIVKVSMGNEYYKEKMDANRHEDSGHLYRNNGNGTFSDVTDEAGVRNFGLTLGIVANDFNKDGHIDLYLSNDFNVPDYYYQNQGDGTFTNVLESAFRHTAMFGMGVDAADFNNDGLTDLFQLDMTAEDYKRAKTNMASMQPETFYQAIDLGLHYQYMHNCLQLNNGIHPDGHPMFGNLSRMAGTAATDWSWGGIFADFDNDGWQDLFVSNGIKRDVNNNDVNAQYEQATVFGREEHPDFRMMPSTPISNYAFLNNKNYTFSKVTKDWGLDHEGFSNGFVVADLDNDGDLDLAINNIDEVAAVYENKGLTATNHFLKVKLEGPEHNPLGLGAKVTLRTPGNEQIRELTLTRGYQSSQEPLLHFGLGQEAIIESLHIRWPDGRQQQLQQLPSDQTLRISYAESIPGSATPDKTNYAIQDITKQSGLAFTHRENSYNDFLREPLLPHRTSTYGPGLAVGDIDQDGLQDVFIGNARGATAGLYRQNQQQRFERISGPWEQDGAYEDTGALFFDADSDGDQDLYVVSGGHATPELYRDRLYLNTPSGFVKTDALPASMQSSGQLVIAHDFDQDGDEDLFVGGRIIPGKYPHPPKSYLLRNDSKNGVVQFTDVTETLAPGLANIGMVTSALWDDFDQDGQTDLIVAGEWMALTFYKNNGKGFEDVSASSGVQELSGWWFSLAKADIDQDGDMDYIGGNLGLNYKYKASAKQPFEVYANDFDENGSPDIVLSYKKKNKYLPVRGRECSSQQVPAIKARFKTYESFAEATLEDIYGKAMLDASLNYKVRTFAHHWFENKGEGTFEAHTLPTEAQFSSVNAIQVIDYNKDSYPDLLLAGNLYQAEVETPRADAGLGLILTGNADGNFEVVPPAASGLLLTGEVRYIRPIQLGSKQPAYLFAKNNAPLHLIKHLPMQTASY